MRSFEIVEPRLLGALKAVAKGALHKARATSYVGVSDRTKTAPPTASLIESVSHGHPRSAVLSSPLTKGACASLSWMYLISRARRFCSATTLKASPIKKESANVPKLRPTIFPGSIKSVLRLELLGGAIGASASTSADTAATLPLATEQSSAEKPSTQ